MEQPVNFDSEHLDSVLGDWLAALREFTVHAVVVMGPNPFSDAGEREVIASQPASLRNAAQAIAESSDGGAAWQSNDSPLVSWQQVARPDAQRMARWRTVWLGLGYQTVIRVGFPLPGGRSFECLMFSPRILHDPAEAALVAWSALNVWPVVRRAIAMARCKLSPRELDCLLLAFEGLTARKSAQRLACGERAVNYHLATAMAKLKVDNKMAAIHRACWMGAI